MLRRFEPQNKSDFLHALFSVPSMRSPVEAMLMIRVRMHIVRKDGSQ